MLFLVNMIRTFLGGKTELGIIISLVAIAVYALPVAPGFTYEALMAVLKMVGLATGVAVMTRIEDKKGFLKALQSLFGAWRK